MSDVDEPEETYNETFDDSAYQACYVFKPTWEDDIDDRPRKRRRKNEADDREPVAYPRLNNGVESESLARIRAELCSGERARKEDALRAQLSDIDRDVLEQIVAFTRHGTQNKSEGRIKTGLVVVGPDSSYYRRLSDHWDERDSASQSEVLITIHSSACPNLQTALRNIVKASITSLKGPQGYLNHLAEHKRLIPMNFDLELLQRFAEDYNVERVGLSLQDVETFDTAVLSQLLAYLSEWTDRIPMTLLVGIATTVELFESRLPSSVIEALNPQTFTLSAFSGVMEQALNIFQTVEDGQVFLGPSVISACSELAQNQSTTIESFNGMLQTAVMGHFFANSLSVILSPEVDSLSASDIALLCDSIRNTDSFRRYCEYLLDLNEDAGKDDVIATVRLLLSSDTDLLVAAQDAVNSGLTRMRTTASAIVALKDVHRQLGTDRESDFAIDQDLYTHLNDLTDCKTYDEVDVALEKMSIGQLLSFLERLDAHTLSLLSLQDFMDELRILYQQQHRQQEQRGDARSSNGAAIDTASTEEIARAPSPPPAPTPKAKRGRPRKNPAPELVSNVSSGKNGTSITNSLSIPEGKDEASVNFKTRFLAHLAQTTRSLSFSPFSAETFLSEAYMINSRQPLQSYFTPTPRFALERALNRPSDYLGCECCGQKSISDDDDDAEDENEEGTKVRQHKSRPATSILYNLLQEAGTTINVRDLFDAFVSRSRQQHRHDHDPTSIDPALKSSTETDREAKEEKQHQAVFYQSLSTLRLLGLVKSSTSAQVKKRALSHHQQQQFSGGDDGTVDNVVERGEQPRKRGKKAYADIDFVAKTSWYGL